ncbi:MAG: ATP synthase F0 subcomplex subunit OSCP atp5 [Lichina confinis]|nr:MAG: ATP synthase F0 subcomplex subunit OSCP atp5 [Lichina confinis]
MFSSASLSSARALSRVVAARPCLAAQPRLAAAAATTRHAALRSYVQAASTQGGSSQSAASPPPPSASGASVKPPVALFGIDGTYASALYTAAAKTSSLENTARAMFSLAELLKKDHILPTILSAPTLTARDKGLIVTELLKHTAGADKNETVKNFLKTLADNNRLSILEGICEKFGTLISVHRGEVEMVVTSAAPLDGRMLSRLETAVGKSPLVGPGKKLKVNNKVNPDILGGLVVDVGGKTIDLSVSSKIAKMNKLLQDTL